MFWVSFAVIFVINFFHIVFLYRQEEGRLQDSRKTGGQEDRRTGGQEDRRTGENPKFAHVVLYRDFGFSPVRRVRRVQDS